LDDAFHRILVVADDPDIVTTLAMTLELEGFEVSTAGSADEAEQLIARHGLPHLALVDIMMPGLSGVGVGEKRRERVGGWGVLMVSGEGSVGSGVEGRRGGAGGSGR